MRPDPHGPAGHSFIAPRPGGWDQVAMMEWELTAETWSDLHPHDELNYVLEGQLFVTCDDVTVEARQGDVVRVPAGHAGTYSAPAYARMLGVYGPNPQGLPSSYLGHARTTAPSPGPADDVARPREQERSDAGNFDA